MIGTTSRCVLLVTNIKLTQTWPSYLLWVNTSIGALNGDRERHTVTSCPCLVNWGAKPQQYPNYARTRCHSLGPILKFLSTPTKHWKTFLVPHLTAYPSCCEGTQILMWRVYQCTYRGPQHAASISFHTFPDTSDFLPLARCVGQEHCQLRVWGCLR